MCLRVRVACAGVALRCCCAVLLLFVCCFVLAWRAGVEPVQKAVVNCVDEKLRATTIRSAGVGHRQGAGLIAELGTVQKLILNVSVGWAAGSRAWTVRIFGVWTTKLQHKARNYAMEMKTIVKSALGK